jgi:uncharacterized RDD family membrane protein YckC
MVGYGRLWSATMSSMPPPPPAYSPMVATRNAAGFGNRLVAFLIDGIIGSLFSLPGYLLAAAGSEIIGSLLYVVGAVAFIVVYCRKVSAGQSWGQKAMKVRVIDASTGSSISAGRVFGRQLAKIISAVPCYLGFVWMLWDGEKRTWHDKIVGTRVVDAS